MLDVFQPRESKAVLAALAALDFNKHEASAAAYRRLAADRIRGNAPRVAHTLEIRKNPSAVALLTVLEVVGEDLSTGQHHTYRGMLSMGGDMLVAVYYECVRQLRDCGAISEEERVAATESLRESIKAAG